MARYIPLEAIHAKAASIQKVTKAAGSSQGPAFGIPYCEMLIRMVPSETTALGMNNRSVGCRNEALKVSGW